MEVAIEEFPFVADMPKRKRSPVAQAWDAFNDFRRLSRETGGLLPVAPSAKLLGISTQRAWELIKSGRLQTIEAYGKTYVAADSIEAYAKSDRKPGRPKKTLSS